MRIGCSPQPCATRTPQPCALSSQSGKFPFWRLISHCAHPFAPPAIEETAALPTQELSPDLALEEEIRRRITYVYPYAALSRSVAKRAASSLGERELSFSMIGVSRPSFLEKEGLSPAEHGAAQIHAVL